MSLEELFRQAECLESGRKSGTLNSIGLNQIGGFFDKVATSDDYSIEGRLFLAQNGVDSARIENIINSIIAEENKSSKENKNGDKTLTYEHIHYPRLANQQVEYMRMQKIDNLWHELLDDALEEVTKTRKNRLVVNMSKNYFPSETSTILPNQSRAETYARKISSFQDPCQVISDSLDALKEVSVNGEPNAKAQFGFFKAFSYILDKNFFTDPDEIGHQATLPDGIRAMVNGSIKFMQEQFLEENLKNAKTREAIDLYVQDKYPDAMAPWAQIWVALRSGLYDVVSQIVDQYTRNKRKSDLLDFMEALNTFVINKTELPTPEARLKLLNDVSTGLTDDPFRQQCMVFAVGQEIPTNSSVALSAEDFIFSLIQPLRFTSPTSGIDISLLASVQDTIYNEANQVFPDSGFILPLLLLLSLNFEYCGQELAKCTIYPCEIVHACIALKSAKLWDSPAITNMIGQFVSFLPAIYIGRAVDYLSFAGDHKLLTNYLLTIDPSIARLSLEGREAARQLIQQDIAESVISVRSLKLTSIIGNFEDGFQIVEGLADDEILSKEDIYCAVGLVTDLIEEFHMRGDILKEQRTQRIAFGFAFAALSLSNEIGLSNLEKLIEDCEKLNKTVYDDNLFETNAVNTVRCLCHVAKVYSYLARGDTESAIRMASQPPHVIPMKQEFVKKAKAFISPQLLDASDVEVARTMVGFDLDGTVRAVFAGSNVGNDVFALCVRMIGDVVARLAAEVKRLNNNTALQALQTFLESTKINQ
ncbi:hypothetical protein TVAG_076100 [Trichomonas vaginalis G3]|uniref:Uncharacterized protein n=1 Tax=Trichomonas vaginalis (strain ATCC PRA-98 / G3) TaxID=412133 RepID=A2D9K7_TRIV3|nr:nuclear pore complex protein NUP93 nucleoporin NUP93 dead eye protein family [Trichomonas vaginalis G3]EAY22863.1 hypothetical protein TVAG_076100 [Trichomonas vaginalis G3]KAI5527423.1 nuclear pore complex protein NUP93 nucleoporin NUP93 dead eye protein family [Trichomonas vaginalis G3]|eukprot:XP_001583849.1 hypothetical protein [Trichomonas vaginalis G3]